MTIDELLIQFDFQDIEEVKRDDTTGKAHIIFKGTYTFWDEKARLNNVVVLFDQNSKIIRGLKLYGFNLESVVEWVDENSSYLWCPVFHYMKDEQTMPRRITSLTLICSLF